MAGWEITAYHDQGKFIHCTAAQDFAAQNETQRRAFKSRSGFMSVKWGPVGLNIGIGGVDWVLNKQQTYRTRIEFIGGQGNAFDGEAVAFNDITLDQEINSKQAVHFINSMREAHGLKYTVNGREAGLFRLNGSSKALMALAQCVDTGLQYNGVQTSGGTFGNGGTFD